MTLDEWHEYWQAEKNEQSGDEEMFHLLDGDEGGFISRSEYKQASELSNEEGFNALLEQDTQGGHDGEEL